MSPDRLTITRAEAIRRRKEEDQKLREKRAPKRVTTPKPVPAPKPAAPARAQRPTPRSQPPAASRIRSRYDIAMSAPYGRASGPRTQAPASTLPQIKFGPRWFSLLLVIASVAALYFYVTEPVFMVSQANITGNNRVSAQDINSILGIANQPAALLNPSQIEYNIRASFPEISGAYVQVDLPAAVTITVAERKPVAAWTQDGQVVWVDAQGYAFPPRGQAPGLAAITASGAPPAPDNFDPSQTIGARPFLTTELANAIATLSPHVPEGAALIYDPKYGLGWADPRGWQAYFGHSDGDTNIKFQVYQTMADTLTQRGLQPSLISVEYPDAPFYRVDK